MGGGEGVEDLREALVADAFDEADADRTVRRIRRKRPARFALQIDQPLREGQQPVAGGRQPHAGLRAGEHGFAQRLLQLLQLHGDRGRRARHPRRRAMHRRLPRDREEGAQAVEIQTPRTAHNATIQNLSLIHI